MAFKPLQRASSKTIGGVSEVAVLAPIRKGRVPGERCTYEERLREAIATVELRVEQSIPTELDAVPTIHFGRMIVIRPEQYLVYAKVEGIVYEPGLADKIPAPIDDFPLQPAPADGPQFRSWLLTLVTFDGDLKPYFKDIANLTKPKFDQIFQNCEDYPVGGTQDFEAFWNWIRRYQINVDLFYPRYPELSLIRIKQLEAFKRRFDAFVAKVRTPTGKRVERMDDLFDEFLRQNQQYAPDFPTLAGTFEIGND